MRRIGALMDIGETDSNAKAWVEAFETQLGKAELAQGAQLGNPLSVGGVESRTSRSLC
jgi:hypothetical protein